MDVLLGSQINHDLFNIPKEINKVTLNKSDVKLLISNPITIEPELIVDESKLLKKDPLCIKPKPTYFKVDNNFSELITETNRQIARKNLGIETADKIKYIPTKDITLNDDFNSAINSVLNGKNLTSVTDALSIIFHTIFPIEYTDWKIDIKNTAIKKYTIETGTTQQVNLTDDLGIIHLNLIPGNKNDTVVKLLINGIDIYEPNRLDYDINVKIKDLTTNSILTDSVSKEYIIELETTSFKTQYSINAEINIIKQSYYFQEIYDEYIKFNTYIPTILNKSTSNISTFNLGSDKKWVSVFSPKNITKVETATSTDGINWGTYFITTGYFKDVVSYTPKNGSLQTYYRVTLNTKQSAYIKIRVS